MPLLILIVQAYFFAGLLAWRYARKRYIADLLLALLLLLQGHHCFSYIIGFMEWYDTFRNTKINYFLFDFTFAIGPLVYFYVKSVTEPDFKLRKRDGWHFLPITLIVVYDIIMYLFDASQPGFDEVQNGKWAAQIGIPIVSPYLTMFGYYGQLLYYAFSVQLYWRYPSLIEKHFSNTSQVALNWIRYFMGAWIALFLFHTFMEVTNVAIMQLHWQQNWWSYFVAALVILFLGIKGYFTNLTQISRLGKP